MENQNCNHDPQYLVKRVRKRKHHTGSSNSEITNVQEKTRSFKNDTDSVLRESPEYDHRRGTGLHLNISAKKNTETLKSVNILAIAAGLAAQNVADLADQNDTEHSSSASTSAGQIVQNPKNDGSETVTENSTSKINYATADNQKDGHIYDNIGDDDDDIICLSDEVTIAKDKSSDDANTVAQPKIIDVIELGDSDSEDDSVRNLANLSKIAKNIHEMVVSSDDEITSSDEDDLPIQADSEAVPNAMASVDEDAASVVNSPAQSDHSASSLDSQCDQEIRVISVTKTNGASNEIEISVELSHDVIANDRNESSLTEKSQTDSSAELASPTPAIDNTEPATDDPVISRAPLVANSSIEAELIPQNNILVEHVQKITTISSVSLYVDNPDFSSTTTVQNNSNKSTGVSSSAALKQNTSIERNITHYLKSQKDISDMELAEHKDTLSYLLAKRDHGTLRAPEIIDNLSSVDVNKSFTVLSYNILSEETIRNNNNRYNHIKEVLPKISKVFEWAYRWRLLSEEFKKFNADICCLQDIEKDKVESFYEPLLVGHGYESFYAWMPEKVTGCGIYWKPEKFEKISEIVIPLNFNVLNLDKSTVAQILHLKHKNSGKELIVANTQLVSDPKSGIEKLYQLTVIFAHLHKIRTNNQPVVFCGDFNFGSKANCLLHKFITDGELDCLSEKCYKTSIDGNVKSTKDERVAMFLIPEASQVSNRCTFIGNNGEASNTGTKLFHSLCFESVYGLKSKAGEKIISAFHYKTSNTDDELYSCTNPDFIFYSVKENVLKNNQRKVIERDLFLHKRLSLPDETEMEMSNIKQIPNSFTGSDHLPLFAEFLLP